MDEKKEEGQMIDQKQEGQMIDQKQEGKQPTIVSDAEVLKLAKKGMKKYRKTLDKLAKN